MFVHGIKPGSSEEEEEEDVMDILMVSLFRSYVALTLPEKYILYSGQS